MRARLQNHFGVVRHWSRVRMGALAGACVVRDKWRRIIICDLPGAEVGLEASPGRRPGGRCCSRARQYPSVRHYQYLRFRHLADYRKPYSLCCSSQSSGRPWRRRLGVNPSGTSPSTVKILREMLGGRIRHGNDPGIGQAWFPATWSNKDIKRAGTHVASLKQNRHVPDGKIVWGNYKGVRVGVIRTYGKIATIFPDKIQPSKHGGRK